MDIVLDIFHYVLIAILVGTSAAWIVLIKSMIITFQKTPVLDKFKKIEHDILMLSLANAFSKENIEDFLKKIKNFLNLKF